DELSRLIGEHEDGARPSCCREKATFFSVNLDLFRPSWKMFLLLVGLYGAAGIASGVTYPDFNTVTWADALLRTTVTIFVLGVSLVNLTRAISEAGRFTGVYLNRSCRMEVFCCTTLVAVLIALLARSFASWAPVGLLCGLCAAALGATVGCLVMLAFVILETIRCFLPGKAVEVVSNYAARELTYAYVKETFVKLVRTKQRAFLEQSCLRDYKSIHPPSQYYTRVVWTHLNPGRDRTDRAIPWDKHATDANRQRDYAVHRLQALDRYLGETGAELFLSAPEYTGKQVALGIVRSANGPLKDGVYSDVSRCLKRAVRLCRIQFEEENEDFWDRQEVALNEAIERAVDNGDPTQVRAYLRAVNEPLKVLRQTRGQAVVRDAYGEYVRRGYDFLGLYLVALGQILARLEKEPPYRTQRSFDLARVVLQSIWEETKRLCDDVDYHTMGVFTWLVEKMYRMIQDAGDEGKPLRGMRAQFGGFYKFAGGWLDQLESEDAEGLEQMRLVLYEGLTKWLLDVLERPGEGELVKQLCDAAREIVFGENGITFERGILVAQHLVFAGHLMCRPEAPDVRAAAVERLFCDEHGGGPHPNFNDLVDFYLVSVAERGSQGLIDPSREAQRSDRDVAGHRQRAFLSHGAISDRFFTDPSHGSYLSCSFRCPAAARWLRGGSLRHQVDQVVAEHRHAHGRREAPKSPIHADR
ncbi:hypothetical protein, partial [Anaerobaca lacustris]|nr:hypothetical protein [Sedimentisphaerales bacterium M17dextr]